MRRTPEAILRDAGIPATVTELAAD